MLYCSIEMQSVPVAVGSCGRPAVPLRQRGRPEPSGARSGGKMSGYRSRSLRHLALTSIIFHHARNVVDESPVPLPPSRVPPCCECFGVLSAWFLGEPKELDHWYATSRCRAVRTSPTQFSPSSVLGKSNPLTSVPFLAGDPNPLHRRAGPRPCDLRREGHRPGPPRGP